MFDVVFGLNWIELTNIFDSGSHGRTDNRTRGPHRGLPTGLSKFYSIMSAIIFAVIFIVKDSVRVGDEHSRCSFTVTETVLTMSRHNFVKKKANGQSFNSFLSSIIAVVKYAKKTITWLSLPNLCQQKKISRSKKCFPLK